MRLKIILITLLKVSAFFSQSKFSIASRVGPQLISVNGKHYDIDSVYLKIRTNYPKFDTLIFLTESGSSNLKVVCNFKPDSSYFIIGACCGSVDVIPKSKFSLDSLKYWDYEENFEKIQNQFLDKPYLSIRLNKASKDSVYAWHSDAACLTENHLLSTELWRLGIPPKCFYWSNITSILFFKTDARSKQKRNKDVEEFLDKKNVVELAKIHLRLFDNQKFILIFNEENNKVKVVYE